MTRAIAFTSSAAGGSVAAPAPAGDKSRSQLEKASLTLHESVPGKGGGASLGNQCGTIPFQFNPKEVTIQKSAKWERKPARGAKTAGPPQFTGAEPCKLTLAMFFDA